MTILEYMQENPFITFCIAGFTYFAIECVCNVAYRTLAVVILKMEGNYKPNEDKKEV